VFRCSIEALNTGKPFREAEGDVDDAIAAFRYCANLAESGRTKAIQPDASALPDPSFTGRIIYEPVGVVVGITPFNFPLMMAAWKVGPALAAGCTIIIKPSEFTPFSSLELAAAAEAVGLPKGVLQVVVGDGKVGNELVTHKLTDKVTFTGSVATGIRVMKAAADGVKRVTLELGGKSPAIIFDDANIDAALEWIIFGAFWNTGQICSATARVLLHESIAPEVTRRLVAAASKLKQGTSFEEGVEIGPSCNKMQFDKVQKYIELTKTEGAKLEIGGGRPEGEKFAKGFWTAPTIFSGITNKHTIFHEEIFGPVMYVYIVTCAAILRSPFSLSALYCRGITTFKTIDEAIELANDSEYGLAAAVFSTDKAKLDRCAEEVRAGVVWQNNAQPSPHAMPWGGFKKSGIGREMGPLSLLPFLEVKSVTGWPSDTAVGWYPATHFTK
jgi:betaine-aldehyde dehydrogenase